MSNLRVRCSIEASTIKNSGALMPNELENKMYITKKARFNAAQRIFFNTTLLKHDNNSSINLSNPYIPCLNNK